MDPIYAEDLALIERALARLDRMTEEMSGLRLDLCRERARLKQFIHGVPVDPVNQGFQAWLAANGVK